MASITITRAQRDILHNELLLDLSGHYDSLSHAVRRTDEDEVRRLRDQAEGEASLLDSLGWRTDDARTEYELPADTMLVDWLRRARQNNEEGLEDSRRNLACLRAGDENYICGATMDESIATTRKQIGEWLTVLDTIDRLLDVLDGLVGAVA